MSVEAYPLHWPPHRTRTKSRKRAPFHRKGTETKRWQDGTTSNWQTNKRLTVEDSQSRLRHELQLLGARQVVLSSNLKIRLDGLPYSSQREPEDPGVAVYFQLNKTPHCLSCDTWDRAADNLAAIAKHVEAMRGQLRWGVADVATMFAGFKALPGAVITPAPMSEEEAYAFLRKYGSFGKDQGSIDGAYREAAKKFHPDTNNGQQRPEWNLLQQANQVLRGSVA